MKIYLVGGAVRDQLLGLPVKEKDWVVVGARPKDLLNQGYKQVGKEFPVFLHPKTAEEYALARLERKIAPGYTGFEFDSSPQVSLEEDLERRDLTINAMAQTPEGELIDPYRGQADLAQKILRHVSPAFAEDPVRILRIARFAARFADLGFTVAPETNELMKKMVASGEVKALVAERVWKELERALGENSPSVFFTVLAACQALPDLFPMLRVEGVEMAALKQAVDLSRDTVVRFAALMHDYSKEDRAWLYNRYRLPVEYRELAELVAKHYPQTLKADQLSAEEILKILTATDAFRREQRFNKFLLSCQALAAAKEKVFSDKRLRTAYHLAKAVDVQDCLDQGLKGEEIGKKLIEKRLLAIKQLFDS